MKYQELGGGVVRRREKRQVGLFIDGTGLDRATRRLNRKVNISSLVRGVTSGFNPIVARYFTLIPYEDDSRQRAFLDAVSRAGLTVVVKRLPPKGVTRQVSVDLEMATNLVSFALGHSSFSSEHVYQPGEEIRRGSALPTAAPFMKRREAPAPLPTVETTQATDPKGIQIDRETPFESRSIVVVCPSRELAYPISLIRELGVDTTTADFGEFKSGDILKSAAKWIDLSDSETIWRE